MKNVPLFRLFSLSGIVAAALLVACNGNKAEPGKVLDEARTVNRDVNSFTMADEDYFHDMDQNAHGVVSLSPEEIKGRNTWIVWTGGDDRFWHTISTSSAGTLDFLKTLSSHPYLKFGRSKEPGKKNNRWSYLGLVNEPCFEGASGPDKDRFGLWLDKRVSGSSCPPDPFENEQKYPGVKIGARGENMPIGSSYGWATGIVGLRLFPNPEFNAAAAKDWNAEKFYTDPAYYNNKKLVKPYRVGMSCGFCHVGPNPLKPPADPENPKWENLSSNVGAQYFWVDRIFSWEADPSSFAFQLFHTSRPGSLDTSLVSTDNINNPRTMNAVYNLLPRLEIGKRWGKEKLAGGGLNNKQLNDYVPANHPLAQYFQKPETVFTPHVLKDGSDSVGALGALNRVYLNIGLFSEEWLLHFNSLVGGKKTTPIAIADARKNSTYWEATEAQTPNMALFFLKTATPHRLKDAPGGEAELKKTGSLDVGKRVFAERCARCHSSKLPTPPEGASPNCAGPGYVDCWNKYWAWTKTPDFKQKALQIVMAKDFLDDNFLSTDVRVPVTLLQTNACSPLATNAIGGSIWDNFSSQSYKDLPSVGKIKIHHAWTGAEQEFEMPAGGRGYTRPASLVSVWSTAPFLLNNSVGTFNPDPSVQGRLASFHDSIEQMLSPETRKKDKLLGGQVFSIDRTTARSYLRVPTGYLPDFMQSSELVGFNARFFPRFFTDAGIEIGPIPEGAPVGLLANLAILPEKSSDTLSHNRQVLELLIKAKRDLRAIPAGASDDEVRKIFANLVEPMLKLSNCPDFEVNRGHYFGTSFLPESEGEPALSRAEKDSLIAFLKTF